VTTRILDVRLENMKGIVLDRGAEDSTSGYPVNGLGDVFTVSESEPVALRLQFEACDMNYQFGLKIKYMLNSSMYEQTVGPRTDPLRMIGVEAAHHYVSTGRPGPDQVTEIDQYEDKIGPWC
jgi:hypothetical protein